MLGSNFADVLSIVESLAVKATKGKVIFRCEPKCFDKVTSNLFRAYPEKNAERPNIQNVQSENIEEAKKYTSEKDEFEILTQLQHYGGKTNLIDFSFDYLIALFFACDGYPESDGRVVMLHEPGKVLNYKIRQPRNPINRVIAQKSIFVESPSGVVIPDDCVIIPHVHKAEILEYLHKAHGITTYSIYNDLIGFTKTQELHSEAYREFHEGLFYYHEEKLDLAIEHYSRAIERNPLMANAYNNRGVAHRKQRK